MEKYFLLEHGKLSRSPSCFIQKATIWLKGCLPSWGMYTETEIIQWWEQIICKQNRLLFLLRKANHSVCNLFNCLFPFQMLFINKLTLTAWSFPFTSISGTSWYQGDKFRATWTVRFAGSRTSWVGPMVSPSVITALIVQRKRIVSSDTSVAHIFNLFAFT